MPGLKIQQRIKYQEDLDPDFPDQVAAMPGAADLNRCIQCGTCSATCPISIYMDMTPRQVVAMTRAGFKKEVLQSNTIWLCASCYSCTAECPKKIKITDIMYALKRLAIQEGVYPKRLPTPVLAREFFRKVRSTGRSNEGQIATAMILKTNPFKLLKQIPLGLKLLLRGRMSLFTEKMSGDRHQLQELLDSMDKPTDTAKQQATA
ncbi:MAG: 4Fe-4S dicluster domain-containing protein [Pirellulales bacterium]|nr:4Fe-4S dicluster domain-containing protein [Pirellulales bacterium]